MKRFPDVEASHSKQWLLVKKKEKEKIDSLINFFWSSQDSTQNTPFIYSDPNTSERARILCGKSSGTNWNLDFPPPHEGTTFHRKIVQSSAQYKLHVPALPVLPGWWPHRSTGWSCSRSSQASHTASPGKRILSQRPGFKWATSI